MVFWDLPTAQFSAFNIEELADPGSTRHIPSGSAAFIKLLSIGCSNALSFDRLRLESPATTATSKVAAINLCFSNFNELISSGLTAVYNMRMYIPSGSGTVLSLPGVSLQFITSGIWRPNLDFPSGMGQEFLTTIPTQFNLRRIDGRSELLGYTALNSSEYVYMRLFVDERFPIGTHGICGSGLLRIRTIYDFY